jgi:hypothetical protein
MVWEHYEDRIALLCTVMVMTRHMGFVGQKDRSSCKLTSGDVPADQGAAEVSSCCFKFIHPINVLFVKIKLPEGTIFPPAAVAPGLNMSRPSAKMTNPLT